MPGAYLVFSFDERGGNTEDVSSKGQTRDFGGASKPRGVGGPRDQSHHRYKIWRGRIGAPLSICTILSIRSWVTSA